MGEAIKAVDQRRPHPLHHPLPKELPAHVTHHHHHTPCLSSNRRGGVREPGEKWRPNGVYFRQQCVLCTGIPMASKMSNFNSTPIFYHHNILYVLSLSPFSPNFCFYPPPLSPHPLLSLSLSLSLSLLLSSPILTSSCCSANKQ